MSFSKKIHSGRDTQSRKVVILQREPIEVMNEKIEVARRIISETVTKRRLSVESIHLFANIIESRRCHKGDILLHEGDTCKAMLYIEKGMLRQYYFKHGKEMTEHISCEKGVVICIDSYFNERASQLSIEALEDSVVWEIPHNAIEHLAAECHEISYLYRCFLENSLILSQVKADMLRFESAKDRYARLMQMFPEIIQRAPLTHIASYLQMTQETLSRVRASMFAEG